MLLLAAGLLALALAVAGIAYAVVRGLRLWRATKRVGREAAPALEHITATTAQIEEQIRRAEVSGEELKSTAARLQRSRARLQVQIDALTAARSEVRRVFWFVPGV